jgi:protoheme IX farnesyltransferase
LVGIPGFILISLSGIMMSICAFYLFREESDKAAKRLMFASFIYLPVVQLALVFDKF